jgi:hypothetical protein
MMTALAEQKSRRSKDNATEEAVFVAPGVGHNSEEYRTKKNLLVTTYLRFRKEEGEHFVRRCQVVVEAEDDLPSEIFKEFCEEVDLPRNSSMFRKARAIAKAADRLLAVSDRLPDSKSTIYELAKLEEGVFGGLVDELPRITAAEARGASSDSVKRERCVIPVDVTALGHGERLTLLQEVQEAADKAGAKIKVPKSLHAREARP